MPSAEERAVEAVRIAAREAVIYQAETQVEVIEQARKCQRTLSGEEEEQNEVSLEVDDSDNIKIPGYSRSLMSVVRGYGLNLYRKQWKNLKCQRKMLRRSFLKFDFRL